VADGKPQRRLVGKQLDQLGVEFADGMRRIETEQLAGTVRAVAKTVPDFPFQILLAAEQDRLRRERRRDRRRAPVPPRVR
jgi:hypothetical protein